MAGDYTIKSTYTPYIDPAQFKTERYRMARERCLKQREEQAAALVLTNYQVPKTLAEAKERLLKKLVGMR